jgi:glycosyltransferase involved in cell wall biosynthesis
MSRILIYTQQGTLGGSFRLLLNLARHLAKRHEVTVAAPRPSPLREASPAGVGSLFAGLRIVSPEDALRNAAACDVLVGHFPFSLDEMVGAPCARRVAVVMEIASLYTPVLDEESAVRFDRILHLHDEQVAHLARPVRERCCDLLPVINNIDFEPSGFSRTGVVGAVGGRHKHDFRALNLVLARSRGIAGLHVWAPEPRRLLRRRRMGTIAFLRSHWHVARGRLVMHPFEPDAARLYASFDCLLHAPRAGNGTSVVVSDALACGKLVVLRRLPGYESAYGSLRGVHFLDDDFDLTGPMADYDLEKCRAIRADYASRYDRSDVLRRWEEAIIG